VNVEIKSPCPVSWNASDRCGTSRFCHLCTKKVYNLSNMTEPEAQAVVDRKRAGEDVCVSFIGDRDGNVLFMRSTAAAAAAAGLLTAQVAMADGAVPTLTPTAVVAPVMADAAANTTPNPLADVSDTDCGSTTPTTATPVLTVEGLPVEPVVVEPYPDDYLMYDGGI